MSYPPHWIRHVVGSICSMCPCKWKCIGLLWRGSYLSSPQETITWLNGTGQFLSSLQTSLFNEVIEKVICLHIQKALNYLVSFQSGSRLQLWLCLFLISPRLRMGLLDLLLAFNIISHCVFLNPNSGDWEWEAWCCNGFSSFVHSSLQLMSG